MRKDNTSAYYHGFLRGCQYNLREDIDNHSILFFGLVSLS
jgi:hypothetical protein